MASSQTVIPSKWSHTDKVRGIRKINTSVLSPQQASPFDLINVDHISNDLQLRKWTHTDKVHGLRKVNTSAINAKPLPVNRILGKSLENLSQNTPIRKWTHSDKVTGVKKINASAVSPAMNPSKVVLGNLDRITTNIANPKRWTHTDKVTGLRKINTNIVAPEITARLSGLDLAAPALPIIKRWSHTDKVMGARKVNVSATLPNPNNDQVLMGQLTTPTTTVSRTPKWSHSDKVMGVRKLNTSISSSSQVEVPMMMPAEPLSQAVTPKRWTHSDKVMGVRKINASAPNSNVTDEIILGDMETIAKTRKWTHTDKVKGLRKINTSVETRTQAPGSMDYINRDKYEFGKYGYGKNHVKLLHVHRDGALHTIREFEVNTHLRLSTQKDFLEGDNKDIIATDSQRNTVYVLAKKHGIKTPEEFALLLCNHFLYVYSHVVEVEVEVEEYPWERLQADGTAHNHAFIFSPTAIRVCSVTQCRNDSPKISGGLRGLRVLKTTQSSFTDFVQDEYRTLPDANDRIFSTIVTATWEFSTAVGVDFDLTWDTIKDCILDKFAGPADTGIYSPSVQNTLYLASKMALDKVNQISKIEMTMPNKHYLTINMSKFPPNVVKGENREVYHPVDKPSGIIYARLDRKHVQSRL